MKYKIITLGESGIQGTLSDLRKLNKRELHPFDRIQIEQEKGKPQELIRASLTA